MMLTDGTCVCTVSRNLFKDMSPLEQTILNSVKFGVSVGYLPSNCQFFNLKMSGDNFKDQWEHRDILAFSSLHAYLPSAAGFSHIPSCFHTSTSVPNCDPAITWGSTRQTWASLCWALQAKVTVVRNMHTDPMCQEHVCKQISCILFSIQKGETPILEGPVVLNHQHFSLDWLRIQQGIGDPHGGNKGTMKHISRA